MTPDLIAAEFHLRQALAGSPGCNKDDLFIVWIKVRDLIKVGASKSIIDADFTPVPRFDPVTSADLRNWPNIAAR